MFGGVLVGDILDFCKAKRQEIIEDEIFWWMEQIDHYTFEQIERILEEIRRERSEYEKINEYLGYEKIKS